MPPRHLFATDDATHGRSLCGLDVKAHSEKGRSWWNCPACAKAWKRKQRVTAGSRPHHTDRTRDG